MSNISVCGSDCAKCCCFEEKMCRGCDSCKGKVFHCPHGEECAIYGCCVTKKGFDSCLECGLLPCDIWKRTRDPKLGDEEFERNIAERIDNLQKCN